MAPTKRGLGKGLDGIIKNNNPAAAPKESAVKGSAIEVDIKKIERNKEQPRKKFDDEALEELSESIQQYGVIQPLLVQDRGDHYEIIAGERRWRASMKAGLRTVPVIIKNLSEQEIVEISLIENIQREDLDAIEEAQAYKRLKTEFNMTDDQVATKVSKSRVAVTNSMRLLKLCSKVQEMLIEDMITSGHARALLAVEDENLQYELAQEVFDQKLSVREIEKRVRALGKPKKAKKESKNLEQYKVHFDEYANNLSEKLGVKVAVNLKEKSSGKLEIDFNSTDEFESFYKLLMK
ncbi:MAG: ParB/RepB/Spo0J family partition protein [Lachnospiraceae bacterium]|nr:ParB/RepB/Spo0J family partition protein [Lachnospiraceae bacterium]